MSLNQATGNMYGFVTHTYNVIKGMCSHDCLYCYMKRWGKQKTLRFDTTELKTDLGKDNFIFVGSSTDMFAADIPSDWILQILYYCRIFENKYLFQTKNPIRFKEFLSEFPLNTILCVTVESNRNYNLISIAPSFVNRLETLSVLTHITKFPIMLTIEPILDFDLDEFIRDIKSINPFQVNIGADSMNCHLLEPSSDKIKALISSLNKFTKIHLKPNLKRLLLTKL